MTSHSPCRLLTLLCVFCGETAVAQATSRPVQVPRGAAVTIDGRVNDAEWTAALRIEHPSGTVVRLKQDDSHLYLGFTSTRPGFASLCLAINDDVHVLHASAALGAVTYRPNGSTWQSADTAFGYGMRNIALNDAATAERSAYLREHGWVASTIRMADGTSQEMQITLVRFPLPLSIALGRYLLAGSVESWPATLDATDGCLAERLVTGYVPQGLRFDFGRWLTIGK